MINSRYENLYKNEQAIDVAHNRVHLLIVFVFFIYIVLICKLLFISTIGVTGDRNKLAQHGSFILKRADILDRNGILLATDIFTESLYAVPHEIDREEEVIALLRATINKLDKKESLLHLLKNKKRSFIWIKRHLSPNQKRQINDMGIPGLYFIRDEKRVYVHKNLFSHILGQADIDNEGVSGIEKAYNIRLKSKPLDPMYLSLDLRIQSIVRDVLTGGISKNKAAGGAVIVMDVRNGEVLAAVSLPDFNPNSSSRSRHKFNQALSGAYEMGSSFKVFSIAMAIASGRVSLNDSFDITTSVKIGKHRITDYGKRKMDMMTPREVLAYSSNVGTDLILEKAGYKNLYDFFDILGFTKKLPGDLSELASPIFVDKRNFTEDRAITSAFGHGIAVTPLHTITAFCALVNGGELYAPTFIKGRSQYLRRVVPTEISDTMKNLLRYVVTNGYGRKANILGYGVMGKTGTAEKVKASGGYDKDRNMVNFLGAYPYENPQYGVFLMLDEPSKTEQNSYITTGGMIAAPLVGEIIERISPVLSVSPSF